MKQISCQFVLFVVKKYYIFFDFHYNDVCANQNEFIDSSICLQLETRGNNYKSVDFTKIAPFCFISAIAVIEFSALTPEMQSSIT